MTIQQEDITLVKIYTPNIEAPKQVKQILVDINGESDRNIVMTVDFNTPLIQCIVLPDRKSQGDSGIK